MCVAVAVSGGGVGVVATDERWGIRWPDGTTERRDLGGKLKVVHGAAFAGTGDGLVMARFFGRLESVGVDGTALQNALQRCATEVAAMPGYNGAESATAIVAAIPEDGSVRLECFNTLGGRMTEREPGYFASWPPEMDAASIAAARSALVAGLESATGVVGYMRAIGVALRHAAAEAESVSSSAHVAVVWPGGGMEWRIDSSALAGLTPADYADAMTEYQAAVLRQCVEAGP